METEYRITWKCPTFEIEFLNWHGLKILFCSESNQGNLVKDRLSVADLQLTFSLIDSTFQMKACSFTFSIIIWENADGLTKLVDYMVKGVQWSSHFVGPTPYKFQTTIVQRDSYDPNISWSMSGNDVIISLESDLL